MSLLISSVVNLFNESIALASKVHSIEKTKIAAVKAQSSQLFLVSTSICVSCLMCDEYLTPRCVCHRMATRNSPTAKRKPTASAFRTECTPKSSPLRPRQLLQLRTIKFHVQSLRSTCASHPNMTSSSAGKKSRLGY